jgi:hypothetical protein
MIDARIKCVCGKMIEFRTKKYSGYDERVCSCGQHWVYSWFSGEVNTFKIQPHDPQPELPGDTALLSEVLLNTCSMLKTLAELGSYETFGILIAARSLLLHANARSVWCHGTIKRIQDELRFYGRLGQTAQSQDDDDSTS